MEEWKRSDQGGSLAARLGWASAFATWVGLTGLALATLANYASVPGAGAEPATSTWPTTSTLPKTADRAALVMVAHTKCACTRASLRELERLMARASGRVDAFVIFVGPREPHGENVGSLFDLRATARAIPGVRITEDENEARLFGAKTSGQVLLYDAGGTLLFRGGITPSRGHEGESRGGETVRRFVTSDVGGAPVDPTVQSDVFGCALFSPGDGSAPTITGRP